MAGRGRRVGGGGEWVARGPGRQAGLGLWNHSARSVYRVGWDQVSNWRRGLPALTLLPISSSFVFFFFFGGGGVGGRGGHTE